MKKLLFLFLVSLLAFSCQKQEVAIDTSSKSEVLKIIEAEKGLQNLNSVSFCVVKEDSLLWAGASGYADKTANKPATIGTRYLIASISKSVTAVAALMLVDKNVLDLDADINKYLPFQVRNPNYANTPITARMLLNHTSSISDGFISSFDHFCWNEDCPIPLGIFLQDMFDANKQFYSAKNFYNQEPGSTGNYSNIGSALLGFVVESLAKQPFDEYCKQNIFTPLGMTKTEWRLKNIPLNELAVPYAPTITPSKPHFTFPDYPNGGLRTTPTDLSKFLRMLINNGSFNGVKILNPQTVNFMQQKSSVVSSREFGSGLLYSNFKGQVLVGHSGGEQGATTEMFFSKDKKVGVIVFTNTDAANLSTIVYSLFKYATK